MSITKVLQEYRQPKKKRREQDAYKGCWKQSAKQQGNLARFIVCQHPTKLNEMQVSYIICMHNIQYINRLCIYSPCLDHSHLCQPFHTQMAVYKTHVRVIGLYKIIIQVVGSL